MSTRDLRRAYIEILETGLTNNANKFAVKNQPDELQRAVYASLARAWLVREEWGLASPTFTTAAGERELRRLKHPIKFGLSENWFPALVATATFVASAAGAGASIYEALT